MTTRVVLVAGALAMSSRATAIVAVVGIALVAEVLYKGQALRMDR